MNLRAGLTALALVAALGAFFMFDAVRRLDAATELARSAIGTPAVRSTLLHRAEALLYGGWTAPAKWHGGAAEAASWIAGLLVVGGEGAAIHRAEDAASRAVRVAPVQPISYMRLAELTVHEENTTAPCTGAACLERSWQAARAIEPEPACTRLELSVAEGLMQDDSDPRFAEYVSILRDRNSARACFVRFPPPWSFQLLLRLNQSEGRDFE